MTKDEIFELIRECLDIDIYIESKSCTQYLVAKVSLDGEEVGKSRLHLSELKND